jgi:hypothetical protein
MEAALRALVRCALVRNRTKVSTPSSSQKRQVISIAKTHSVLRSFLSTCVISRVNYFFSEGAVPPGTVPSNFRISPFCPTAQPW